MPGRPEAASITRTPIPARAGIGLRTQHHAVILTASPAPAWIEAHTENYFHDGGPAVRALERARGLYPLSLHGVGLGLGSADPLDRPHLERVRRAVQRFEPALVSEHACWGYAQGEHFNDLLPLPYTEEAVEHLAARVRQVQDVLGRQILIENLSAYVSFADAQLTEGAFLAAVVERSGCGLLLDVNNAYVNARNLGLDLDGFFDEVPAHAVQEIHLAGHSRRRLGTRELLIDDHGRAVCDEVWALYAQVLHRLGPVPTLIEWDTDVPDLAILLAEAARADAFIDRTARTAA
ncbi:MAG: DUF692 domain-containing protein [Betaproteobacteria bacterium]|nr:DUF692 domain-containing protein [Betaproteobacteria bacterium]